MTRAEKAAMEAYPPKFVTPKRGAKRIQSEKVDTHAPTRAIYIKGYEDAEKDTLKRAVEWWRPRLQGILSDGLVEGILEEFRNGMK